MEKAIKKSIEGGYKMKDIILQNGELFAFGKPRTEDVYNKAVLDPLFWQALSKAEGWEEFVEGYDVEGDYGKMQSWKNNWHRFIDHLAEVKDINSFFEELFQ